MSRLDWERFRRQELVWKRGGDPVWSGLDGPRSDEADSGYVVGRREPDESVPGERAGRKVPRDAPTLRSRRARVADWPTASRLAMEWTRGIDDGGCIVVKIGSRQILAGRSPDRFVAMAALREMHRRDFDRLNTLGLHPAEEKVLDGNWWIHSEAVREYSLQGRLVADVMRDVWRLRLPMTVEVGDTLLGGPEASA